MSVSVFLQLIAFDFIVISRLRLGRESMFTADHEVI